MNEDIKIAFGEDGKAYVLNDEYCIYCADEKTLNKIKEALEKQKKKKPIKKNPIVYRKNKDGQEHCAYEHYCPLCDRKLILFEHHCFCGQTLDWSDTDA